MQSLFDRIIFLAPNSPGEVFWDLLQILLVAYGFYRLLLLVAGTRAIQMLLGLILLFATYALAEVLELELIRYLLQIMATYGAFAAIVVFQPELRSALTKLGQSRYWQFFSRLEHSETVRGLAVAAERLARDKIGAIIAIEREVGLGEYASTGTPVNAPVSVELVATIFTPYSPLHDGAVIVRGDTIVAAGCILPLTKFPVTDRSLGTRHRAAIGLSEETDAFVLVVSEETGAISVAQGGRLEKKLGGERLLERLGVTPAAVAEVLQPTQPAAGDLSLVDRSS